jgi:hypothetical protein
MQQNMLTSRVKPLEKLRTLSVLLLVTAFLLLSYCPLRRTLQNLIKCTYGSEQSHTGHSEKVTTPACTAVLNSSISKEVLPQVKFNAISLAVTLTTIVLLYLCLKLAKNKDQVVYTRPPFSYLTSIHLHLRYLLLLI